MHQTLFVILYLAICLEMSNAYGMRFHFKKKYFRIMLQVFHRDVAKVDLDVVILHVFHTDVASVLSGCCIFIERFRMFHIT